MIADDVGTCQAAFQHRNRSNDPVTLVATSTWLSPENRHNPNVRYAVTCAGRVPSERFSRTPHAVTASSTASRGTCEISTPSEI